MLSYISEKYDLFFNGKPDIDVVKHYNNLDKEFKHCVDYVMKKNHITVIDAEFYKFYITYCICFLQGSILQRYNVFFKTWDNISSVNRIYVLHQLLRNGVEEYIESGFVDDVICSRNLVLNELINKNK
jgi:hypothetical protein